jgi:DNA repair protein RadC
MFKVKELPLDERPREKLILRGAQSLSDAELLAILIRTGKKGKSVIQIAIEMLKHYDSLGNLSTKSIGELTKSSGIGKDKATTLLASFEIGRRMAVQLKHNFSKSITSPGEVAEIFIPLLGNELKEKFLVVCLNSSNKIVKHEIISVGNLDSSLVHPREVFKVAIENSSKSIILVHNHPSGNPEPSSEDISITKKLIEAGKIFDIPVFDHIIVAGNKYTSLVEKRVI